MKKLLIAVALLMAFGNMSIEAAKKETTEEVKKKKSVKKKAGAEHAAKPVKIEKKEVKKTTKVDGHKTKVEEKKVTHETKAKPAAHETKRVKSTDAATHKGNTFFGKNSSGDKVIGKTAEGREIYEGPRGGHYYMTASGNKEYIKQ